MSRWSVVGSGVAGLCVATLLAEQGETPEVIVSDETPASHWAGGMLAPFCEGESAPEQVIELGQRAAKLARHAVLEPAARAQAAHPVAAGGAVVALIDLLRGRPRRQACGNVTVRRIKKRQG